MFATKPMPIRFDKDLIAALDEGARVTPHKKQELVRLTLRRYLPAVIEAETIKKEPAQVTNIRPWPKGALAKAYKKVQRENWDEIESTMQQTSPSMDG